MRELVFTRQFDRLFRRLPKEIRDATYQKLDILLENPSHPSLRLKRIRGTQSIWELSVTMNYRITLEMDDERILLRRIGTHDILRRP